MRTGVKRYELKDPTGKKGRALIKNETPEERDARRDRQAALRLQVRRAALKALKRNRGLAVGYSVYVYDGPITDAELDAAVAERALRRSDPEAYEARRKLERVVKEHISQAKEILAKRGEGTDQAISAKYGAPPPMPAHRIPPPHDVFRHNRIARRGSSESDFDSESDADGEADSDAGSASAGEGRDDYGDSGANVIILE